VTGVISDAQAGGACCARACSSGDARAASYGNLASFTSYRLLKMRYVCILSLNSLTHDIWVLYNYFRDIKKIYLNVIFF